MPHAREVDPREGAVIKMADLLQPYVDKIKSGEATYHTYKGALGIFRFNPVLMCTMALALIKAGAPKEDVVKAINEMEV